MVHLIKYWAVFMTKYPIFRTDFSNSISGSLKPQRFKMSGEMKEPPCHLERASVILCMSVVWRSPALGSVGGAGSRGSVSGLQNIVNFYHQIIRITDNWTLKRLSTWFT